MSLVRLLTAGKSLIGVKDPTSRYQMRSRHLLPKFNPDKNPFAAPKRPPAGAPSDPAARELTPPELAAAESNETKSLSTHPPTPLESRPATRKPAILVRALDWFRRRTRNRTRRESRPSRKAESKPALPRFNKSPVQTELSLDQVRVVRNDLSEADVEVVAARPTGRVKDGPWEPVVKTELAESQKT